MKKLLKSIGAPNSGSHRLATVLVVGAVIALSGCQPEPTSKTTTGSASKPTEQPQATSTAPPINEQSFRQAAAKGQIEVVRKAIKQGIAFDAADANGRTALHFAAFNGHTAIVRQLLAKQPQVDQRDTAGRTPLMYASSGPYPETVALLLESGADPNLVDTVERFSALMFASAEGHVQVVRTLLIHGADSTLTDADGETAADFAAQNGRQRVVKLFQQ